MFSAVSQSFVKMTALLQPSFVPCVSLPTRCKKQHQADIAQLVEQRIRNA
jgi:hypothetical protein